MQTPKGSSTLQRKELVSVSIFLLEGHMNSSTCTILKLGIGAEIKDTNKMVRDLCFLFIALYKARYKARSKSLNCNLNVPFYIKYWVMEHICFTYNLFTILQRELFYSY